MAWQQTLAYGLYRSAPEAEDNPVQHAVLRVFDRVVDASNPSLEAVQVFVGRMLLRPPQVRSPLTTHESELALLLHAMLLALRSAFKYGMLQHLQAALKQQLLVAAATA